MLLIISAPKMPNFSSYESYMKYLETWKREYSKLSATIRNVRAATKSNFKYPDELTSIIYRLREDMKRLHDNGKSTASARIELRKYLSKMRSMGTAPSYVGNEQSLRMALRKPAREMMVERERSKVESALQRARRLSADKISNSRRFAESA